MEWVGDLVVVVAAVVLAVGETRSVAVASAEAV